MVWTKSYVYLGGRLLATDSTTGVQYHHPDRLGTRLVTNTSGAVVSENINLPFGATISGESLNLAGSATKKRFTSYDRSDTTKLDYAVSRHYSSAQGRFTQVDPIGMSATQLEDPQSLNLYAYVGNDPINYTDPDGLFSFKNLLGGIYRAFAKIAAVVLVVAVVIALSMASGPGAMMIFKMVLGAVKFAIDGWGSNNRFLRYVSAGIGAYLGFSIGGSMARTPTFGAASGATIGAVSAFISDVVDDPPVLRIVTIEFLNVDAIADQLARAGHWLVSDGLAKAASASAGFGDALTTIPFTNLCGTCAARKSLGSTEFEEESLKDSWYYTGGEVAGDVAQGILLPYGAAKASAKLAGRGVTFGIHNAHHGFPGLGRVPHLEVVVFKPGVKNSQRIWRRPFKNIKYPKKSYNFTIK